MLGFDKEDYNKNKESNGLQAFGLEKLFSLKFSPSSRKSLSFIKIENCLGRVC